MEFTFFKKYRENKIKEFLSHCRQNFIDIYNKKEKLTKKEYESLGNHNSYEHNLLTTLWDDELLIEKTEYYLSQAWGEFEETDEFILDASYNDVLKHKIIHMLLKRLKEKI